MVLLDLSGAGDARFGNSPALAVRIADVDVWEKPAPEPGGDPTLMAAYNFEGTGDVFLDSSGNSRDVAITAAQRTDSFAKNGTYAAKSAAVLAGGSSGVAMAPYNALGPRTMMGWVSYYALAGIWMLRWQNTAIDSGVFGVYFVGGVLRARARRSGTSYNAEYPGLTPVMNEWYHIATTYDAVSGALSLYLNGALAATTTVPGGGNLDAADFIDTAADGAIPGNNPNSIATDDVRIYSRALSAAEIVTDMNTAV